MIMFAGAASVEVLCVLPRFVGQSVRTKGKLDHAPPTTFEVLCAGCAIEGSCASQTHLRRCQLEQPRNVVRINVFN